MAKHLEDDLQTDLFRWAEYHPKLEFMYAVPNGGKRNKREAVRLKKQGVKSGVYDICLPIARHGYHGLYLELKIGKNNLTDNQKRFKRYVEANGYRTETAYNLEEAINIICGYSQLKKVTE